MTVAETQRREQVTDSPNELHVRRVLIGPLTQTVFGWFAGGARVTPEWARATLLERAPNRLIRPSAVRRYSRQMRNDQWQPNPSGLGFDADWLLVDGQHTLCAVVDSGVTLKIPVYVGLTPEMIQALDQGVKRSAADVLGVDKDAAAVAQALAGWATNGKRVQLTAGEIGNVLDQYSDEIYLTLSVGRTRTYASPQRAQIAAAAVCGEPHDRLLHFAKVLAEGVPKGNAEESPIFLARNLLNNVSTKARSHQTSRKIQRAIKAFCADEPLSKLYDPRVWPYPLPSHPEIQHEDGPLDVLTWLKQNAPRAPAALGSLG